MIFLSNFSIILNVPLPEGKILNLSFVIIVS